MPGHISKIILRVRHAYLLAHVTRYIIINNNNSSSSSLGRLGLLEDLLADYWRSMHM